MNLHPYQGLDPDTLIGAVESLGYLADGRLLALNSYENRVYQIGIEDAAPLVGKFYRPERWSDAAIEEEHRFALALASQEIPVVPPLLDASGHSLHRHRGFRFALYPRQGGRSPELEDLDNLRWLGRFLGRIHQLGAARPFEHRPTLTPEVLGDQAAAFLLQGAKLPLDYERRYRDLTETLLKAIHERFAEVAYRGLRLHGDCHPGNVLWTDQGPHFVDLDDCCNGPAVQDLWMLILGEPEEVQRQWQALLEGYETFRPFNPRELTLVEPLRCLRMIHYAAWLARRWDDPAFPQAFPWFGSHQYWQQHLTSLEQQLPALEAPPIFY